MEEVQEGDTCNIRDIICRRGVSIPGPPRPESSKLIETLSLAKLSSLWPPEGSDLQTPSFSLSAIIIEAQSIILASSRCCTLTLHWSHAVHGNVSLKISEFSGIFPDFFESYCYFYFFLCMWWSILPLFGDTVRSLSVSPRDLVGFEQCCPRSISYGLPAWSRDPGVCVGGLRVSRNGAVPFSVTWCCQL